MSRTRSLLTLVAVVAVTPAMTLTGCSPAAHHASPSAPLRVGGHEPNPPGVQRVSQGRGVPFLARFDNCDGFLSAVKHEALSEVTAYGLPGGAGSALGYAMRGNMPGAMAAGAVAASGSGTSAGGAGSAPAPAPAAADGFSTTNNQEEGVDEPDLTKTDGHLLVLVRHDPLGIEVMRVDGDAPSRLGFLALDRLSWDAQLLLAGSLVVAIGPSAAGDRSGRPVTLATVVSIADPSHPRFVRTFRVPGTEVDARLIAGRVVLVVQRYPELDFRPPANEGVGAGAAAHNRDVVASSRVTDWLPPVTTWPSRRSFAPACDAAWHGSTPQGVGTVAVVSIDPGREDAVGQTTVVGNAGTVYASTTGLFLATPDWRRPTRGPVPVDGFGGVLESTTTRIHAFDLHSPAAPRYVGSGTVAGQIVDQYSLSEYDGDLRVATTVGTAIPAPGEGAAPKVLSDSRVTVLRPQAGALVQVGQVRGLGRGERIYGVRFLGDVGYVVTFRSIDPLYVLDLSDARHPREVSHLEVTGYSAYLHPLGDGLLFGLGRRVNHRAAPIGEQLSVFDVSSPAHPALRSRAYVNGASSPAEDDHHAFLWWAKDRLVVVPMTSWDVGGTRVAVYHVDRAGQISRVGDVTQPQPSRDYYGVERSIVIGGVLYVVSDAGVLASDLHSLKRVAWVPFR